MIISRQHKMSGIRRGIKRNKQAGWAAIRQGKLMREFKRKLRRSFSCHPEFNRWCLKMKRSFDEVCYLLDCPCGCKKKGCKKDDCRKDGRRKR